MTESCKECGCVYSMVEDPDYYTPEHGRCWRSLGCPVCELTRQVEDGKKDNSGVD